MIFSSLEFLEFFLPITLLVYFLVPPAWRNFVLFAVSIVFYGWGEPTLVFLMLVTLIGDWIFGYFCGKYRETDKKKAKLWLVISCVFNLGILGFFKYYNFFADNISLLFGRYILPELDITLPIGISFYTFQAMSYVIDVCREMRSTASASPSSVLTLLCSRSLLQAPSCAIRTLRISS